MALNLSRSHEFYNEEGRLEIIIGPMFSGKTSKLTKLLTELVDTNNSVLYINSIKDERVTENGDDLYTTHCSQSKSMSPKIEQRKVLHLADLDEDFLKSFDTIGIDEGQFFDDLLLVRKWVLEYNLDVIVASLSADSDLMPFGDVHNLICLSNIVTKLFAFCHECLKQHECGRPKRRKAHHTFCYIDKSDRNLENAQELAGGADLYIATCLACHKRLTKLKMAKNK